MQSDNVTFGDLVTVQGLIDTGAGNDVVNINGRLTGNVDTGSENDQINLAAAGTVTGGISGGTGVDTINGGDVATTYIVSAADSG
ncbi:MAG: hypothetical protein ACKVHE_21525, partial [Planctomycetales bacterium]